jgi:hypothetical protein
MYKEWCFGDVTPWAVMRLEGLGKLKKKIAAPSGLEPATFRPVATA